jgi:hypothetical protein
MRQFDCTKIKLIRNIYKGIKNIYISRERDREREREREKERDA